MGESRLCGYCRVAGHTMPNCPTVKDERTRILTHTPQQRLETIKALGKLGLGIGAMIQKDGFYDPAHVGVIDNFDWLENAQFAEFRNIKYSKRVKTDYLFTDANFTYRRIYMRYVAMGNGSAMHRNLGLNLSSILNDPKQLYNTSYDKDWKLVNPSHDIDFDPDILVRNILVPPRLRLRKDETDKQRGYMPIIKP